VIPGRQPRARVARSAGRRFLVEGRGARVRDADGNEYVDYVGSWGPLVLGHADPGVLAAVRDAMERGTSGARPVRGRSRRDFGRCRRSSAFAW
jgi:glutamate-1-semialdehyde aminotransferase